MVGQSYSSAALLSGVGVCVVFNAARDGSEKYRLTGIPTPNPAECSVLPYRPNLRSATKFRVDSLIEAVLTLLQIKDVASSKVALKEMPEKDSRCLFRSFRAKIRSVSSCHRKGG